MASLKSWACDGRALRSHKRPMSVVEVRMMNSSERC